MYLKSAVVLGLKNDTQTWYTNTVSNNATTVAQIQSMVNGLDIADQVFLTYANSPYTVSQADNGKALLFDTSGGNIVVNLPSINPLNVPYIVMLGKTTNDTNTITYNANGTDTLEGAASVQITAQNEKHALRPDKDPTPKRWAIQIRFNGRIGSIKDIHCIHYGCSKHVAT